MPAGAEAAVNVNTGTIGCSDASGTAIAGTAAGIAALVGIAGVSLMRSHLIVIGA